MRIESTERGFALVSTMLAACASASSPASPVKGGIEVAPMVFRCEGWRHSISLAQDGSILADGRKVAWIEDGKMRLLRSDGYCALDSEGKLVDHKGGLCTGALIQVLPDRTLHTQSGIVRFEGEQMVFGTDGGTERLCAVQGYRQGREGAVAILLATAGVVVMVDAIDSFVGSGLPGARDAGAGGRD